MLSIAAYFGYLASLLLILALLVNNDLKFRWFNLLGNIFFIIYGLILIAVPVLITNVILFAINIYYLLKIYRRNENFDLIEFTGEEKLVNKFLQFYHKDIASYFPSFKPEFIKDNLNFVVLRDLVIANMFSAKLLNNGDALVNINYTSQRYRDYKVGRYIFDEEKQFLLSRGVKRIVYTQVDNKQHKSFLKVMGFSEIQAGATNWFIKEL